VGLELVEKPDHGTSVELCTVILPDSDPQIAVADCAGRAGKQVWRNAILAIVQNRVAASCSGEVWVGPCHPDAGARVWGALLMQCSVEERHEGCGPQTAKCMPLWRRGRVVSMCYGGVRLRVQKQQTQR
jgi:hypothetical protein